MIEEVNPVWVLHVGLNDHPYPYLISLLCVSPYALQLFTEYCRKTPPLPIYVKVFRNVLQNLPTTFLVSSSCSMYPNNQEAPSSNFAPPPPIAGPPFAKSHNGQWSTGLCDCFDDPSNCLITCCCPCITVGQIVEIVDRGTTSCLVGGLIYAGLAYVGCGWLYSSTYRSKLRGLFSLPEAPCVDWLVHCCCCACSTCQEYRELKIRGADPSLGWEGNVEKWNREGLTPPIVAYGMAR